MTIRVTVTADQLAMMVSNDEQRNAWIERYENEIEAIKRNGLRDAKERYEKKSEGWEPTRYRMGEGND